MAIYGVKVNYGTLKYRQFFSTLALTLGSIASLGLVLSIPATFSVEQTFAATTKITSGVTTYVENPETDTLLEILANTVPDTISNTKKRPKAEPKLQEANSTALLPKSTIFTVPFFSQLTDITDASWKKVGCGITGLAMLIEYYYPGEVDSVDTLLHEGIALGAYDDSVGWSYNGLISVAQKYGITGSTHDYKGSTMDVAFTALKKDLNDGPVMASVHYTFQPTNPIPHLVIIKGIKNDQVYYNDPADKTGGGHISIEQFKSGWKKRYIEFYPVV